MPPKRTIDTVTGEIMSVWIDNFSRYVVVKMDMDASDADDVAEADDAAIAKEEAAEKRRSYKRRIKPESGDSKKAVKVK